MDTSVQAEDVIRAGRGGLMLAMLGAGWLGWGLGSANAFNVFVGPAFGFTALFLLVFSFYFLRKGRQLRKSNPEIRIAARQISWKWFSFVVLLEAIAIVLASTLANRLLRADLAMDWCALIAGLHFLPLARVLRAPSLSVLGILMTLWCIFCWVVFHSTTIAISTALGTGILLWGTSAYSLLRARRFELALRPSVNS